MQTNASNSSNHYVFIADNEGMNILFPVILDLLKKEEKLHNHISILYFSENEPFVFMEELEILTARFRDKAICYFKGKPHKEFLEMILVTNIKNNISFQMAIDYHWQEIIVEHLLFLGVNSNNIHFLSADNIYQNK